MSHNAASPPPRPDLLDSLDDSKISRFQIKIMFVWGTGFFTDAYDLDHERVRGPGHPRADGGRRARPPGGRPSSPAADRLDLPSLRPIGQFAGMVLAPVSQRCASAALPVVLVKAAEPASS